LSAKLFIPAHISGFWYIHIDEDILKTGSYGAGLVLSPGLLIEYFGDDCMVNYNGVEMDIKVYRDAHRMAGTRCIGIKISSQYGIGEGYGASAGIAIGGICFSFHREKRRRSWIEIGRYAHMAEVENVTGYGDVITEIYGGGLEVRVKPGAPGVGMVDRIPVSRKIRVLTVSIEKYTTGEMFRKYGGYIDRMGREAYDKFIENPSIERFGEISHEFSVKTGMMNQSLDKRLKRIFRDEIRKGSLVDYFVKKGLLVVIAEEGAMQDVYEKMKKYGEPLIHILNFSGIRFI
jgi:pantoate kinase